jgi:hypothetical protein
MYVLDKSTLYFPDRWIDDDLPSRVYVVRPGDESHLGVQRPVNLGKRFYLW